jgi:hypothetical protein
LSAPQGVRGHQILAKLAERGISLELIRRDGEERIIARPTPAITEELRAGLKENRKSILEALRPEDAIRDDQEVFALAREYFGSLLKDEPSPESENHIEYAAEELPLEEEDRA